MTEREQEAIDSILLKLKELEQIHEKALEALNAVQGRDQVVQWKKDALVSLKGKISESVEKQLAKDWLETSYIVGDLFDELSDDVDMCRRHLKKLLKDIQTHGLPDEP
ncbi:MAG: hypothetical protein NPIRA05_05700 [Nitrospirales bacterium]|nr:MAG: hypothetical protein NPIRA05_05700 [Nitrospirales bacterium]